MSSLTSALEKSHQDLQRWFLLHQECLLVGHDDYALKSYAVFHDYLTTHLHFENLQLFPLIEQLATLKWPIAVYYKEHDKLLKLLANNQSMLQDYCLLSGRKKRIALLDVLDSQRVFRQVMEHHEEREESDLFLHIDQPASEALLANWLEIDKTLAQRVAHLQLPLEAFLAETAKGF